MVTSRNWSELPHELLECIAAILPTFEDYLSFVGVCRSWRSILNAKLHYAFIRKSFPWLMLPQPDPWLMLSSEESDESDEESEETDESDEVEDDESNEVEDDENAEVEDDDSNEVEDDENAVVKDDESNKVEGDENVEVLVEDDENDEVEDNESDEVEDDESDEDEDVEDDESDEVEDDDKHHHVDLGIRNFYSLPKEKVRHLDLPGAVDCYCWGSPYGWLVTCREEKMNLLNPLSNVYVALPPLSSLQHYNSSHSVRKAVLAISPASNTSSATPLADQFVTLVIFSGNKKLAFARPGDRAWKTVNSPASIYEDILHINNQFYAVDIKGDIWQFDISNPDQVALHFACRPGKFYVKDGCRFYLVEWLGKLLIVARLFELQRFLELYGVEDGRPFDQHHKTNTSSFKVYKLDLCTKQWKKVRNLRRHALFLGNNTSFSLLISKHLYCQWNAIYFTDDYDGESTLHIGGKYDKQAENSIGMDMGIFNLYCNDVDEIYREDDGITFMAPPVWITPNLY